MFASLIALALAVQPAAAPSEVRGPVTGAQLAAACRDRSGWSDPAPPAGIAPGVFYVGTCGITALLITTGEGHVLIDGATEEAAPHILANIRALGHDPRDVRYILTSHEHLDHVGGVAALKAATGARLVARAEARSVLESGRTDPADPQAGAIPDFAGVSVDQIIADGETLSIGGVTITAHATPGHTPGGTSWSWRSCAEVSCHDIVYADSLSAVSADGYRFTDHPARVAPFRTTFDRVAGLGCDLLITPHPGASNLFARMAGEAPLRDANACRAYADGARERLDQRLAREAAQ